MQRSSWNAADRRRRLRGQDPIAELIHNIESQGYHVRLPDFNRGNWCYGFCRNEPDDSGYGLVVVFLRMPNGRFWSDADIAFLLAHEYMHIIHYKRGMFKEYYKPGQHNDSSKFITALAAERHCDRFAKEYIDEFYSDQKSALRDRVYPSWRVQPRFQPDSVRLNRWFFDRFYEAKDNRRLGKASFMDQVLAEDFYKNRVRKMLAQQGVKELIHV